MPGNASLNTMWTMARTAQPQCYDVVVVKNTLQRTLGRLPTRKEISDKFHRHIRLADGRQEDYIENFVRAVVAIYETIFRVPSLAQIIVEPDSGTARTLCGTTSASWLRWHQILQTKRKGSGPWTHWRTIISTRVTCQVACPKIYCRETGVMWASFHCRYSSTRSSGVGWVCHNLLWGFARNMWLSCKRRPSHAAISWPLHRFMQIKHGSASCALPQPRRSVY